MSFADLDKRVNATRWWARFSAILGWVAQRYLWDAISVEVALFKMHEAVETWPKKYEIYRHGIHDENPHVWFDAPRLRTKISTYAEIIWKSDQVLVDGVYHDVIEEGNGYLIVEQADPDGVCPCGLRKSDHDRYVRWAESGDGGILKLARPIVIPVRQPITGITNRGIENEWTSGEGDTIRVMLEGLTTRDVQ